MTITALPDPPSRADDPTNFTAKADAFMGALPGFVTEANALAADVTTKHGEAVSAAAAAETDASTAADAAAAAVAAAASAINAPGTSATSTTSITIGTGSKTFTIQTGKAFAVGQFVVAASAATPANYMLGQITAHNSGTGSLTVNVTAINGSGTLNDWSIAMAADSGGLRPTDIGVSVQGYDADTAKTDVAQSWTAQQAFKELKETVYTITDGAGFEIDPANGSVQIVTLGANRTPAATNFEAGQAVTLLVADGSAYTITWTTVAVTWVGGSAPPLATSGYTVIELWKIGSTIYGKHVGDVA